MLLLACLAQACGQAPAQEQPSWPATEYGVFVGTGLDAKSKTGLGYGIEKKGFGPLVERVEKALDASPRQPDFLLLHCFGAWVQDSRGTRQMELNGWEVLRDGGYGLEPHPVAVETLGLWGDLLEQREMTGVLYLGSPYNPTSREYYKNDPEKWRRMVDWTLNLAKESGFQLVAFDAIVRHGKGKGPDEPMRLYLLQQAQRTGLRVVVEAWPHKMHESIFAGAPVWLTYKAFGTQHPRVTFFKWGQAPAEGHTGLVVYGYWNQKKKPFDASTARKIADAGCLPAVDWNRWTDIAGQLPAKPTGRSALAPMESGAPGGL